MERVNIPDQNLLNRVVNGFYIDLRNQFLSNQNENYAYDDKFNTTFMIDVDVAEEQITTE